MLSCECRHVAWRHGHGGLTKTISMNAHPTSQRIPDRRLSPAARPFLCSLAGRTRLLAGALLFLLLAAASRAPAQTISNCLQVICPPPFVTNYVCNDQPVA